MFKSVFRIKLEENSIKKLLSTPFSGKSNNNHLACAHARGHDYAVSFNQIVEGHT